MPHSQDQNRKVIFFHIPKTGGMTFRGILQTIYGDSFLACSDPTIGGVEQALKRFDCLEFHLDHYQGTYPIMHSELAAQGRWDLLKDANIFTMLRDPVEQSISLYCQIAEEREMNERIFYKPHGIPFPESLEEFVDMPWHLNTQLHFLFGETKKPSIEFVAEDLAYVKNWLLDLQVHVGLTERYADSLHVFEQVTERYVPESKVEKRQQNKNRLTMEQVPNQLRDRIRNRSALDMELYEFGRELLEKDVRQYGKGRVYSFFNGKFERSDSSGAQGGAPVQVRLRRTSFKRKMRLRLTVATIQTICFVRKLVRRRPKQRRPLVSSAT